MHSHRSRIRPVLAQIIHWTERETPNSRRHPLVGPTDVARSRPQRRWCSHYFGRRYWITLFPVTRRKRERKSDNQSRWVFAHDTGYGRLGQECIVLVQTRPEILRESTAGAYWTTLDNVRVVLFDAEEEDDVWGTVSASARQIGLWERYDAA